MRHGAELALLRMVLVVEKRRLKLILVRSMRSRMMFNAGDLGLVHIVEVLLGKVGKGRDPQNNSHQHDTT